MIMFVIQGIFNVVVAYTFCSINKEFKKMSVATLKFPGSMMTKKSGEPVDQLDLVEYTGRR